MIGKAMWCALALVAIDAAEAKPNVFVEPCERAVIAARACCEQGTCDSSELLNDTKQARGDQAAAQALVGTQGIKAGAAAQQALLLKNAELENKQANLCAARVDTCSKQCRSAVKAGDSGSQAQYGTCQKMNERGRQLSEQANSDRAQAQDSGETDSSSSADGSI